MSKQEQNKELLTNYLTKEKELKPEKRNEFANLLLEQYDKYTKCKKQLALIQQALQEETVKKTEIEGAMITLEGALLKKLLKEKESKKSNKKTTQPNSSKKGEK